MVGGKLQGVLLGRDRRCGDRAEELADSKTGKRQGPKVRFPRRKKKTRDQLRCTYTTGALRVDGSRTVVLPRAGAVRTAENIRPLWRHVRRGTARLMSATIREKAGRWSVSLRAGDHRTPPARPAYQHRRRRRRDREQPPHRRAGRRDRRGEGPQPESAPGVSRGTPPRKPGTSAENGRLAALAASETQARPHSGAGGEHPFRRDPQGDNSPGQNPQPGGHRGSRGTAAHPRPPLAPQVLGGRCMPGRCARQLTYKAGWYGCDLRVADRWYPSSKTCSACGHVNADLSPRRPHLGCPSCGTLHDRDENAGHRT